MSLEELNVDLKSWGDGQFGVMFLDNRAMVAQKRSQPESFLGYSRSLTGIAWPVFNETGEAFSLVLASKIVHAQVSHGVRIMNLGGSAYWSITDVSHKIKTSKCDKIVVVKLNSFEFDGAVRMVTYFNIQLSIFDSDENLLFDKKFVNNGEEFVVKAKGRDIYKNLANNFKLVVERIFMDEDFLLVLNTVQDKKSNSNSTEMSGNSSDRIITKSGDEINATVIEISSDFVKYRLSTQPEGPVRILKKSEIFMIKYKNGDK
jgi:hypothetical protein